MLIIKKLMILFIIFLAIPLWVGCSPNRTGLLDEQQEADGLQNAINNSIQFIKANPMAVNHIDTSSIQIDHVTNNTWKSTVTKGGYQAKENSLDLSDWIVTIGNRKKGDNFQL